VEIGADGVAALKTVILTPPLKETTPLHVDDRTARISIDKRFPLKEIHNPVCRTCRRAGPPYKLRNGQRWREVHQRTDDPGCRRPLQRSTWPPRPSPWIAVGTSVVQEQRRTFKDHMQVSRRVDIGHPMILKPDPGRRPDVPCREQRCRPLASVTAVGPKLLEHRREFPCHDYTLGIDDKHGLRVVRADQLDDCIDRTIGPTLLNNMGGPARRQALRYEREGTT
jgi:hypothetical protein